MDQQQVEVIGAQSLERVLSGPQDVLAGSIVMIERGAPGPYRAFGHDLQVIPQARLYGQRLAQQHLSLPIAIDGRIVHGGDTQVQTRMDMGVRLTWSQAAPNRTAPALSESGDHGPFG